VTCSLEKAVAESFIASLEKDLLRDESFVTPTEARGAIFDYIEGFYNPHRIHSTIGCMSPIAYEANYFEAPDA
jgi:putative transposase